MGGWGAGVDGGEGACVEGAVLGGGQRRGMGVKGWRVDTYVPALVLGALKQYWRRGSRAGDVVGFCITGTARVRAGSEIRAVMGERIESCMVGSGAGENGNNKEWRCLLCALYCQD